VLLIFLSFVLFFALSYDVFTFWVSCCEVRDDFHIKAIFGLSLPPVVCRLAHVIHVICVCLRIVVSNTYHIVLCFFFVLCKSILQVSRDCQFIVLPLRYRKIDNPERLPTLDTQNTRRKQTKQKNRTQCMSYTNHYAQTNTNNVNKTRKQLEIKPSHSVMMGFVLLIYLVFLCCVCILFVFVWHLVSNVKPLSELSSVYLPLFLSCYSVEK
jgi:hypothetical protein